MDPPASSRNWSEIWEVEDTDENGYGIQPHYAWYGAGVIVMTTVGCVGNIAALCVFLHPNMRSPFGVYVCALLIVDIFFLIFTCLVQVPRAWLSRISIYDPSFWDELSQSQGIYVAAFGITELARALVIWYTVALLAEQYCVIYKPTTTLRFSSTSEKVVKICITILNLTILAHLMQFFKLVLKPIDIEDYNRICLSDIYTNDAYRLYDVYLYFIFFGLSAWVLSIVFCSLISMAVITSRYNIGEVLPDQRVFRVFKNGRSIRTSLILGLWYILCFAIANVCYIATWCYEAWDSNMVDCHFRPGDKHFVNAPEFLLTLHDVCVVLNSSFRFPLIYIANSNFRRILYSCFQLQPQIVDTVSSALARRPVGASDDQREPNAEFEYTNRAYLPVIEDYKYEDMNGGQKGLGAETSLPGAQYGYRGARDDRRQQNTATGARSYNNIEAQYNNGPGYSTAPYYSRGDNQQSQPDTRITAQLSAWI